MCSKRQNEIRGEKLKTSIYNNLRSLIFGLLITPIKFKSNNLWQQRVYLAGAIDRVADRGSQWRECITPKLKQFGLTVLNPLKKPLRNSEETIEKVGERHKLKAEGFLDEVAAIMKRIRNIDLRLIDVSDFIIVYINMEHNLFGTVEEIVTANRSKKPILVVIEQGVENAPDWLLGMIGTETIFNKFEELFEYLKCVNEEDDVEKLSGRWVLFDWSLC